MQSNPVPASPANQTALLKLSHIPLRYRTRLFSLAIRVCTISQIWFLMYENSHTGRLRPKQALIRGTGTTRNKG